MFGEIDYSLPNPPGSSQHLSHVLPGAPSPDIQQYSKASPTINWRYYSLDFFLSNINNMPNNDTTSINSTLSNYSLTSQGKAPSEGDAPDYLLYLIIPLYSLAFVIGTIGNILVILTVFTVKQMRNTTNALILHLAIANLSFVLMCIPHTIYFYAVHSYYLPTVLCKLANTLMYISSYVSIYILVLMSIDRFLGVVFAVKSVKYRTERNAHLAVIIIWLIGIIFASPNMVYFDVILDPASNTLVCLFRSDTPFINAARRITAYFFALSGLIIPLIIIVILYGLLINVLRKNAKGKQVAKGKKRVTKMVSAVISSFVICWTPMQIYLLYIHHTQASASFTIISQSLVYISPCVNPILYAFLSEPFRKAFKQFLTCSTVTATHATNQNGNEALVTGKASNCSTGQRQRPGNKPLPLKSNINNNHRIKKENQSSTVVSETVKYNLVSNTNTNS